MTVPRGVTDPLTLGTLYVCTKLTDADGIDLAEIFASNGTFLQEDGEVRTQELNIEYYMHTGATALASGSTSAGYHVIRCTVNQGNKDYKTMSVQCHKHTAASVCSVL